MEDIIDNRLASGPREWAGLMNCKSCSEWDNQSEYVRTSQGYGYCTKTDEETFETDTCKHWDEA